MPGQDHDRRRRRGLGRVDHPVPGGELRGQGHHRGHGRAGRRQGPAREHRDLALAARQDVVVRLRRRHRQLRRRGHRHGALGHQGQAPGHERAQPAGRRGPREAARRSPPATPTTRTSARWSRRPRSGSRPACTASRSASASAATRAWATSTTATSSTCAGCARAWGPKAWIMIDCGWNVKWDVMTAVRRVQAFEEYDLPGSRSRSAPGIRRATRNLRSKTTTLIAYGEKEWNVDGLRAGPRRPGTVDVVGIDPGRAEGITGLQEGDRAHRVLPAPGERPLPGRAPSAPRPAWR